jgi:hypothetical protein
MSARYASFREFYPFYLSEHANRTCRRLHVAGSTLVLIVVVLACISQRLDAAVAAAAARLRLRLGRPFLLRAQRPATFTYPLYSFAGDWVMYWQVLTGRIPF